MRWYDGSNNIHQHDIHPGRRDDIYPDVVTTWLVAVVVPGPARPGHSRSLSNGNRVLYYIVMV